MQNPRRPFTSPDDLSVVLTYYLQAHLSEYTNTALSPSDPAWAQHVYTFTRSKLEASRDQLIREVPVASGINLRAMLSHRPYFTRVAEIVLERLRAGPDAPSLRIAPGCLSPTQTQRRFGQGLRLGLIYGAETIYMQDTVLALQTDADRSQPSAATPIHILGVPQNELTTDMKAKRALSVDETGWVSEVRFEEPLALDLVQILHLPREGEQRLHRQISTQCERLRLPQINPYRASERADDKEQTHQRWSELRTPIYHRIDQDTSEEAVVTHLRTFLSHLRRRRSTIGLVVQPNRGTEGQGVAYFEIKPQEIEQLTSRHPVVRYLIDHLLSEGDALLREERGMLRYRPPEEADKGVRRITLRIHVAWNGSAFVAESGYAQVALDQETFVTSRSRGGTIVGLGTVLSHLYAFDPEGRTERPVRLTPDDLVRIRRVAAHAAYALNRDLKPENRLKFMGIDVVLERSEAGHVIPVLLEVNPRPAGLQHAEEIPSTLDPTPVPKVTFGLFNYLRAANNAHLGQ